MHESNTVSKHTHKVISTVYSVLIAYRWRSQFLPVIEGSFTADITVTCAVLMQGAVTREEDEQAGQEYCDKVLLSKCCVVGWSCKLNISSKAALKQL